MCTALHWEPQGGAEREEPATNFHLREKEKSHPSISFKIIIFQRHRPQMREYRSSGVANRSINDFNRKTAATASSRRSQRFSPTAYDAPGQRENFIKNQVSRHKKKYFLFFYLATFCGVGHSSTISCKFERGCYDSWETHRLSAVHAKRADQHTAGQGKIGCGGSTTQKKKQHTGILLVVMASY